ncbi:hypothetical protein [Phenylobacterium sp.]|uniref:hypothetical protein n=1 Tax=Phenylobacterium sp. TaxID=1871053 RepID=UPI003565C156
MTPAPGVGAAAPIQIRSRLLLFCSVVGWCLAVLVAIAFLLVLRAGRQMILAEQRHSHVSADAFIARVRACRRQAVGPMPSWNACERHVRSEL